MTDHNLKKKTQELSFESNVEKKSFESFEKSFENSKVNRKLRPIYDTPEER